MTTLPKYLREEAVRALNRAAKLTEDTFPSDARYFEQTAARIAPVKRLKKPMQKARERGEKTARQERNANTGELRARVEERAGGFCEACGGPFTMADPFSMDEWLNGNGRRTQMRSYEACWGLHIFSCHRFRQTYKPNVEHWNALFEKHCAKFGFKFTPHIEHAIQPKRTA